MQRDPSHSAAAGPSAWQKLASQVVMHIQDLHRVVALDVSAGRGGWGFAQHTCVAFMHYAYATMHGCSTSRKRRLCYFHAVMQGLSNRACSACVMLWCNSCSTRLLAGQ